MTRIGPSRELQRVAIRDGDNHAPARQDFHGFGKTGNRLRH